MLRTGSSSTVKSGMLLFSERVAAPISIDRVGSTKGEVVNARPVRPDKLTGRFITSSSSANVFCAKHNREHRIKKMREKCNSFISWISLIDCIESGKDAVLLDRLVSV